MTALFSAHSDRVYVLTGASRGLGLATAEVLVAAGARVVISSRDEARVQAAVAQLGPQAAGIAADNATPEAARQLFAYAKELHGRVDGVLVSVGGPPAGSILEASDEQWRTAFESVFLGAVRIGREAASELGEGGSVVLVLSVSAKEPIPGLAISNGLRPGLAMLTKELASQVGPSGIRVNALMPGRIATDRIAELESASPDPASTRSQILSTIPLGRYGAPAEFGRAAAFLLGRDSSYVTGALLPVDGGMLQAP